MRSLDADRFRQRRRWFGWIVVGISWVAASLVLDGAAEGGSFGAAIVAMGLIGGDKGIRFAVPFGTAVAGYYVVADRELSPEFFAVAAQVIPVLILASLIEQRAALLQEARSLFEGFFLVFTLFYMFVGEFAALRATGTCADGGLCRLDIPGLDTSPAGAVVSAGLFGGFASILVAALLPAKQPSSRSWNGWWRTPRPGARTTVAGLPRKTEAEEGPNSPGRHRSQ